MRKLQRMTEPVPLRDRAADLTQQWEAKATTAPTTEIYWPAAVREATLPRLMKQTENHCSICDGWPVEGISKDEIEHFVPKKRPAGALEPDTFFRSRAYAWRNLFYICSCCNGEKLAQWNPLLLKPDATLADDGYDYEFALYFECDRRSGKLHPWRHASVADKERAETTIRLYGLNEKSRPLWRREQWHKWRKDGCSDQKMHRRPYRFFLEWQPPSAPVIPN